MPAWIVIPKIKAIIAATVGIAFVLLAAWGLRVDHLRSEARAQYQALLDQTGYVVIALREATRNPDIGWNNATAAISELGNSNDLLAGAVERQNTSIADMAREAVELRAQADELRRLAERAQAQRRAALTRLNDMALSPGTREDCEILLAEANEALDLVREQGL